MHGDHNIEKLNLFESAYGFLGEYIFKNEFALGGHYFETIEEYIEVIRVNTGVTRPNKPDLFSCMFKAYLNPEQSPFKVDTELWFARTADMDMYAYRAITSDREYIGNDVAHLEIPIKDGEINFAIGETASMMKLLLMKDVILDTQEFIDPVNVQIFRLFGSEELDLSLV
jgi:hypothetical protein